jgi:hypothetical protein
MEPGLGSKGIKRWPPAAGSWDSWERCKQIIRHNMHQLPLYDTLCRENRKRLETKLGLMSKVRGKAPEGQRCENPTVSLLQFCSAGERGATAVCCEADRLGAPALWQALCGRAHEAAAAAAAAACLCRIPLRAAACGASKRHPLPPALVTTPHSAS